MRHYHYPSYLVVPEKSSNNCSKFVSKVVNEQDIHILLKNVKIVIICYKNKINYLLILKIELINVIMSESTTGKVCIS